MVHRSREGALSDHEKSIVKGLLGAGWRNQDIQALLNVGRPATVNSGRVTEVKKSNIAPASDVEIEIFRLAKESHDPKTGLNSVDDERLIRAREAMVLAVQIFNSGGLKFKTEVFAVLANIAWTYLLHEHYVRKGEAITSDDGRSWLLSQMIKRADCPLSTGTKNNLNAIKTIRDDVEHKLLGGTDIRWFPLFQACCLNFENNICKLFSSKLSLQNELSIALQFAKLNIEDLALLHKYPVPEHIEALDARLRKGMTEEEIEDLEYQLQVVYTLNSASKSRAHIRFLHPGSDEAEQVRNILLKMKPADELYPLKPKQVVELVKKGSGRPFTTTNHTQAWQFYRVRPGKEAREPSHTRTEYCIYHSAHGDYTYNQQWVDHLIAEIADDDKWQKIKSFRR